MNNNIVRNLKSVAQYFLLSVLIFMTGISCQQKEDLDSTASDSSFFQSAYAQDSRDQATDNIYSSRRNAITEAVAKVSPAVVGINVTQVRRYVRRNPLSSFFPELYRDRMYERKVESIGSGFIISRDGYIITNDHVVSNASEIVVTMTNGENLKAELIGSDALTDIALLKVEGNNFPYIEFGRSDDLIVGEWVIALGNPFGLVELNDQPTVTVGVISAIDRDWGRTKEGHLYLDMIQTDAAINHGNSGGPLVNSVGQVIGMNTFIFTGSQRNEGFIGIGFAIPISKVNEVITAIREEGGINREYWLGIYDVRSLNRRIIRALDLSIEQGVIVTQLDSESPAYRSGVREYDVITHISNQRVTSRDNFIDILRDMDLKVGTVIGFTVVREDQTLEFNVTLEKDPGQR